MVKEKTLIIGTKQEIKDHTEKTLNIHDNKEGDLHSTDVGTKFFNYNMSFDIQVPDSFSGYKPISYLEIVSGDSYNKDNPLELLPTVSIRMEILHIFVRK